MTVEAIYHLWGVHGLRTYSKLVTVLGATMLWIAVMMVAKLRVVKLSCHYNWVLEVSITAEMSHLEGLDPMRHLRGSNKPSQLSISILK